MLEEFRIMPYYEYRCADCGEVFEVLQKIGADNQGLSCPVCGGLPCEKLMSVSVFQGGSVCKSEAGGGGPSQGGFS